jgi:hypothetical protein
MRVLGYESGEALVPDHLVHAGQFTQFFFHNIPPGFAKEKGVSYYGITGFTALSRIGTRQWAGGP